MRVVPALVSIAYLVLVAVASAPIFSHPLSPLSGVLVIVLTIPWSIIAAIVQATSKATWLGSPAGFVVLTAAEALLNAVILYWIVGHKLTARKRRREEQAGRT